MVIFTGCCLVLLPSLCCWWYLVTFSKRVFSDPCLQIPGCLIYFNYSNIPEYLLHGCLKYSELGACSWCSASPNWSSYRKSLLNPPFPCLEVSICDALTILLKKVNSFMSLNSILFHGSFQLIGRQWWPIHYSMDSNFKHRSLRRCQIALAFSSWWFFSREQLPHRLHREPSVTNINGKQPRAPSSVLAIYHEVCILMFFSLLCLFIIFSLWQQSSNAGH